MLLSQISPACTNSSSNLSPSPFGFPITFIPSRFRSDLTWQDHQCLSLLRPWGASLHIPPLALNVLMCLMQTTWHDLQSSSSVLLLLIFLPSFLTMLHVHVHNLLSSSIITALYCLKVSYSLETTFFLSECPLCMELSPPPTFICVLLQMPPQDSPFPRSVYHSELTWSGLRPTQAHFFSFYLCFLTTVLILFLPLPNSIM